MTVFSADNLAAWAVGGYKALASAFRKCQYCMVTDTEMQREVRITWNGGGGGGGGGWRTGGGEGVRGGER